MTDAGAVSERYRRLAGVLGSRVEAAPVDRWSSPSPCSHSTARDVVRHVVETHGMFLGFVGRSLPPDVPSVDDDPAERADAEYDGFGGRSTFAQGVDRFLCFDLNVHGWDLARAAGLDAGIDPDEQTRLLAFLGRRTG